ncbi:MAG: thiamine phosphate synthase [Deltaproteobacteria bacterium]|nr:thiamine phosphate synthase [Deltaproteobacteria bacterium]
MTRTPRACCLPSQLYPIIDTLGDPERSPVALAEAMLAAGVRLLQLRVKDQPTWRFVELARAVQARAAAGGATLIINDRADIALLAGAGGVHLGQEDLPPAQARRLLGPAAIIGVSTHNLAQAQAAAAEGVADYLGFGPIYATTSKSRPDPVQGLAGLRQVRAGVALPIVAIGGITRATMAEVLAAGADAVAVIGDIVRAPDVRARVEEFLAQLAASRGA